MAISKIPGAGVSADTLEAGDIADDAIGTAELANDVTISTSGNIATTGSGTLSVAGTSTLTGNVTAAGTHAVTGNATVGGTLGVTGNATASGNLTVTGDFVPSAPLSNRNMIINGAMTIAQRGISSTSTGGAGFYHTADRMFNFDNLVPANFTRENTNGVLGTESGNTFKDVFPYSWKFASNGTVSSIPAGDRIIFIYKFEGQDVQHLAKGTANAKPVTLSFWVKSTQTGNHQVNITDDNSRMIGAVYAISSANTWEKKIITFPGDTTGGTIDNDNTQGLAIEWWLTTGSTYSGGAVPTSWEANAAGDRAVEQQNYVASSGRTWQITGIQLEVGSNATPFEHLSHAVNQGRCDRYFQSYYPTSHFGICFNWTSDASTTNMRGGQFYRAVMRAYPSATFRGSGYFYEATSISGTVTQQLSADCVGFYFGTGATMLGGEYELDAELY